MPVVYVQKQPKRYGFWSFVGDCFMMCITAGLWFIWIVRREFRRL